MILVAFSWAASKTPCAISTSSSGKWVLIGTELFGFGAKLLTSHVVENVLQPASRLLRCGQRGLILGHSRLRLRQLRPQFVVFLRK
jgi:hypothetical protein